MKKLVRNVALCCIVAMTSACSGAIRNASVPSLQPGSAEGGRTSASAEAPVPRVHFLIYADVGDIAAARKTRGNAAAVCGMLDAAPSAGSDVEKAFSASYFRALRVHPDCPLIGVPIVGRDPQSRGPRTTAHCYDWTTQDPDGSGDQVPGGSDYSGCFSAGGGGGGGSGGSPGSAGSPGGGGAPNPLPFNSRILAKAISQDGVSDRAFVPPGTSCAVGCVYTVNGIIQLATGEKLCGDISNTDQIKGCAQTALVSQATSKAGDLIIVDSINGKDAHVGICLNSGCTQMNSNSSRNCTFTFGNQNFDYPGSPYHNGYVTYWRMIS